MCGISGIFNFGKSKKIGTKILDRMIMGFTITVFYGLLTYEILYRRVSYNNKWS